MAGDFWKQINIPTPKTKKHTVIIAGTTIEVDLATKIQVQTLGEHFFMLDKGKIVRKPLQLSQGIVYAQWKATKYGYEFVDDHMYWPMSRKENGKGFVYE